MNSKLTIVVRHLLNLSFIALTLLTEIDCLGQCTPAVPSPSDTCKGTHLTSDASFGGAYYLNGTEAGITTTTFKGTTYRRYTQSLGAGDTLRICSGANIELSNATLGVIIVEPGSQILLTNTSSINVKLYNYGIVQSNISSLLTNSSTIVYNKGIIDMNNNNYSNSGDIINHGLILNINQYTFNNSNANTCIGPNSVFFANQIENNPANNAFLPIGGGVGCVSVTSRVTGSRCLTPNGAANSTTNIQFCHPTGIDLSDGTACTTSGTVFGTALNGICTPGVAGSNCNYPLPFTLLDFKAYKNVSSVMVKWTVVNQIDSDHYEILKSNNGKDWQLLGSVASYDHGTGTLQYSLTDTEPTAGFNYYKLVEVDINGKRKEYSVTSISWTNELETDFSTYPNPTEGELNVTINGPYPFYQFEIIDLRGNILSQITLPNGNNSLGKILTASSMYFLRLKVEANYITKKVLMK